MKETAAVLPFASIERLSPSELGAGLVSAILRVVMPTDSRTETGLPVAKVAVLSFEGMVISLEISLAPISHPRGMLVAECSPSSASVRISSDSVRVSSSAVTVRTTGDRVPVSMVREPPPLLSESLSKIAPALGVKEMSSALIPVPEALTRSTAGALSTLPKLRERVVLAPSLMLSATGSVKVKAKALSSSLTERV